MSNLGKFEKLLSGLNQQQLEAVESIYGPVLMIAGPGSGKTHVLALRIANILRLTDTDPSNILALTFTESAAENMYKRLVKLIGNQAYKIKITTFHGFCNDLIRSYPQNFYFARNLNQVDDIGKYKLLLKIVTEAQYESLWNIHKPDIQISNISQSISNIKREGVSPEKFGEIVSKHQELFDQKHELGRTGKLKKEWEKYQKVINKNQELADVFKKYQAALKEEGMYDFDDMIMFVVEQLRENPEFTATVRENTQFILLDEYQDTNGAQNELVMNK